MGKAVNKNSSISQYYNLRFERKFILKGMYLEDIINSKVLTNEFQFREVYTNRGVNNIYFDDSNYNSYKQNVSGDGLRKKFRLRWYGDEFSKAINPTLEIKKKFGEVGDKYSFKLHNFKLNIDNFSIDEIRQKIIAEINKVGNKELAFSFQNLFPTLFNKYERRYFLSACGRFRITLDYNMKFYNPNYKNYTLSEHLLDDDETIFELKYKTQYDNESRRLTQQLNKRISKNSKYVKGIDIITN